MQLFAFGINHQTAPLEVRERVAFNAEGLPEALRDLVDREPVREAAIISTCNRTEVYCSTQEPAKAVGWLADYHHLKTSALEPYVYTLPRERAVKHAFRVASGLDSMVLGEPQILGQIKQAVRSAEKAGTLGLVLHKLFQHTFSVAKEVRSRTEIGASSVSMAAAAVRLAERIFPSVAEQKVLFIGAGEMIELTATHFGAQHPRRVTFANRTLERAEELAGRLRGQAVQLNDLADVIAGHDIIVTCTASPLPIIGKGMVESALKARRHRPMLMIDLAVPRDVETEVGRMDDVFLYTVDDLGKIVQEGTTRARRRWPGRGDHRRQGRRLHALAGGPRGGADDPRAARPGRARAPPRDGARAAAPAEGRAAPRRCSKLSARRSPTSSCTPPPSAARTRRSPTATRWCACSRACTRSARKE